MGPYVIVGAGGFGREIAASFRADTLGGHRLVGFLDDDPALLGVTRVGTAVVGTADWLDAHPAVNATVGVAADVSARRLLVERLALDDTRFVTLVHPSVSLPPSARIGVGTTLLAGCVLTADVTIGNHVVVMPTVVFTHDDVIGDGSVFGAGVRLAGGVTVGPGAFVGSGALVREGLTIGAGSRIGMGSVVTRDVPAGETWFGVPARPVGSALDRRLSVAATSS